MSDMSEVDVINFVDSQGGLDNAFDNGLRPECMVSGGLKAIVEDAYFAYLAQRASASHFYYYAENCSFEE